MAARLIVDAEVEDHDAWGESFDARAVSGRSSVGAISSHHEPANRSTIAVLHSFESVEAAESFISNPELAERVVRRGSRSPRPSHRPSARTRR
jgi:hypothetical protein